jgi:hypothetical protein
MSAMLDVVGRPITFSFQPMVWVLEGDDHFLASLSFGGGASTRGKTVNSAGAVMPGEGVFRSPEFGISIGQQLRSGKAEAIAGKAIFGGPLGHRR